MGARVLVSEIAPDPEAALARMTVEPMAAPDPATLGPRDVVVAVRSASVGWVDVLMASGQYQHRPETPYTPGLEYAGEVWWAGTRAGVEVGARVLVDGFLAGPRSLGAYQRWGGFASWAVAPAEAVRPIPGALSFDQACNLLGSYETAYHCLVTRGRVRAGETVLVLGASGATGLAAVHLCKLLGARVIAAGRSVEKLARVKDEGADEVVAGPLKDRVKALTGGKGVDVVYDGVGGEVAHEALRCVDFGARFLIVGWASSPTVRPTLPVNLIMIKGVDVLGCPTVISTVRDPSLRPPRLARILAWAEEGRIRPHVSHAFPLTEVRAALTARYRGEVIGGCVVHP